MIKGMHVTLFTPKANEVRAFIRDKLELPASDVGEGWLIFDVPQAEIGVHPTDKEGFDPEKPRDETYPQISFYCDDIYKTLAQLKKRGVKFTPEEPTDEGYALSTNLIMPGGAQVQLYQPRYSK